MIEGERGKERVEDRCETDKKWRISMAECNKADPITSDVIHALLMIA